MKNLTPTHIYWITLLGIALCFLAMGYIVGFARGWNHGHEDCWNDIAKNAPELPAYPIGGTIRITRDPAVADHYHSSLVTRHRSPATKERQS